jgi:hypothetical protein
MESVFNGRTPFGHGLPSGYRTMLLGGMPSISRKVCNIEEGALGTLFFVII